MAGAWHVALPFGEWRGCSSTASGRVQLGQCECKWRAPSIRTATTSCSLSHFWTGPLSLVRYGRGGWRSKGGDGSQLTLSLDRASWLRGVGVSKPVATPFRNKSAPHFTYSLRHPILNRHSLCSSAGAGFERRSTRSLPTGKVGGISPSHIFDLQWMNCEQSRTRTGQVREQRDGLFGRS